MSSPLEDELVSLHNEVEDATGGEIYGPEGLEGIEAYLREHLAKCERIRAIREELTATVHRFGVLTWWVSTAPEPAPDGSGLYEPPDEPCDYYTQAGDAAIRWIQEGFSNGSYEGRKLPFFQNVMIQARHLCPGPEYLLTLEVQSEKHIFPHPPKLLNHNAPYLRRPLEDLED